MTNDGAAGRASGDFRDNPHVKLVGAKNFVRSNPR